MSKVYDFQVHSYVAVQDSEAYPFLILLYCESPNGDRVWIPGSWDDEIEGAVQVGDGLTNGYDQQGCRILSVPVALCKFYSEDEARDIIACMDADETLLAYAHG
jgi:hypothetical protein